MISYYICFYTRSKELSVIHFYAPWAEQCTVMNGVMEEISKKNNLAKYAKMEAENVPDLCMKFGVAAVPTFLLLRNSSVVDQVNGANALVLNEKIQYHTNNTDASSLDATKKESLDDRLKKLINQAPCMLFMKGTPANPRCGFSRTIVSILDSYKADYQSFDILEDNDVREGLKKYSNWPTYPQLYISGELVGGLDIVKESHESGELESMLPKKS